MGHDHHSHVHYKSIIVTSQYQDYGLLAVMSDPYHFRIQLIMQCGNVVVLQSMGWSGMSGIAFPIPVPNPKSTSPSALGNSFASPSPSGIGDPHLILGIFKFLKNQLICSLSHVYVHIS